MKAEGKMPIFAVTLFALLLTPIAGLAAQLCRIGHGGIAPVGILTPYAALLFLGGGFDLLPLWIAISSVSSVRTLPSTVLHARGPREVEHCHSRRPLHNCRHCLRTSVLT